MKSLFTPTDANEILNRIDKIGALVCINTLITTSGSLELNPRRK